MVKAPCPRLEEALKEAYRNESLRPETPSAEYYRYLSFHTGLNMSTITDIEFLYNTLEIEEQSGLKLPEWTKNYYNRKMQRTAARSLTVFTSNTLQRRLRGGLIKFFLCDYYSINDAKSLKRSLKFFLSLRCIRYRAVTERNCGTYASG